MAGSRAERVSVGIGICRNGERSSRHQPKFVRGVLADKFDKRKLIMTAQTIASMLVFVLATLTLVGAVEAWHIIAIAFLAGVVEAFYGPAHESLYPHLVERKALVSAVALDSSLWQGNRIIAPAIAGVIIATAGTAAAFFVAGIGFITMAIVLSTLKVPPIPRTRGTSAARDLLNGFRFLKNNSIVAFLIGMTFFNSFFGMAYVMLMPIFAVDILDVGAKGQGLLLGMSGAGALVNTLYIGARGSVPHRGLAIIAGAVLFGLAVAAFALTAEYVGSLSLAMGLMFIMGIFNSLYMISIQSSLQIMVPDRMRGRVMGFYGMTWSIMPLGGMQASALTSVFTAPIAIAAGGLAVAIFALGPAMLNSTVRNLSSHLTPLSDEAVQEETPAPPFADDD